METLSQFFMSSQAPTVPNHCMNFPPPEGCIGACEIGYQVEAADYATIHIADDPFYSIPGNSSFAQPGQVLRWQDLTADQLETNFTHIPAGMSLSRFIYMTEDIDRKPIPASAFVLVPYTSETVDERDVSLFPVIAWAHGTSGRILQCAPSNNNRLYYGWEGPFFMASNGFAVIGTDYAGQGVNSPGGFNYEAGMLHAADIAYSVVAAKSVIGHLLTDEWVVSGHSEGGMATWRTNERLAMDNQEGLLAAGKLVGAVSACPALRPCDLIAEEFRRAGEGPLGEIVSVYILQSLAQLYPTIKLEDYLTEEMLSLIPAADATCLVAGQSLMGDLTIKDVYRDTSWITSKEFQDWQNRYNEVGASKLAVPMLVIQPEADTMTYTKNTEWDFNRTCEADPDANVELYLVPGLDHDTGFQAAQSYYIRWIKQRFAGAEVNHGCKTRRANPVTNRYKKTQDSA